ncbi:hypothetical protein [Methanosarcina mazei]|uniref:hypothetical protein n=1 Tax=Methanosarcina mazei TaxID=2209 RepID=UPI000AF7E5A9|nr:hypothetical protein [Methanosarcina mazei]
MLIRKETKTRTLEDTTYCCKCDICGKEFQTRWGASSCCSNDCYKVMSEQNRKEAIKRSTQRRKERRDAVWAQLSVQYVLTVRSLSGLLERMLIFVPINAGRQLIEKEKKITNCINLNILVSF